MGQLPAFITGVPEESLDVLATPSEFSVGIGKNVFSEAGQGDRSAEGIGVVQQFSREAILTKITINLDNSIAQTGVHVHYDAVVTVSVRGFKIFGMSHHFDNDNKGDLLSEFQETFDLFNAITVQKGDRITYKIEIKNKLPDANVEIALQTNIVLFGEFRP